LRLCFGPKLRQKKYIILQALQTGASVSCLGASCIVKVAMEKPGSTNIHSSEGVLTQVDQDPFSWSA